MNKRTQELLQPLAAERIRQIADERARLDEEETVLLHSFPGASAESTIRRAVEGFTERSNRKVGGAVAAPATSHDRGHAKVVPKQRQYAAGSHWMQRPENKEKLMKLVKKAHRARRRNAKARAAEAAEAAAQQG